MIDRAEDGKHVERSVEVKANDQVGSLGIEASGQRERGRLQGICGEEKKLP